jgi:hypothetical protein
VSHLMIQTVLENRVCHVTSGEGEGEVPFARDQSEGQSSASQIALQSIILCLQAN